MPAFTASIRAVSYTHLDVYKRQTDESAVCADMAIIAAYMDYTSKIEKIAMGDYSLQRNGDNRWKEYGLKKAVQRI